MDTSAALHALNRALEAAPLVPFACAWVRRHQIPYAFRPVYYFVAIKTSFYFLDTFSRIVFRNNVYLYHLSAVVMVVLLARTYLRLEPQRFRQLVPAGIWLFALVAVLDAVALNGLFKDVNSYSQAFGCAFLIILAILHVVDLTRNAATQELEAQPDFFLCVATLVYCSSSIVSYVALNIVYNSGYDRETVMRLDTLISSPDTLLMAVQMGLLAWMFHFFPLSVQPRRALPAWLHYSNWHRRPYKLLGRPISILMFSRRRKSAA
ncbi:hypothetical protein GCM10027346_08820 [Hymenobacter seoulensis]